MRALWCQAVMLHFYFFAFFFFLGVILIPFLLVEIVSFLVPIIIAYSKQTKGRCSPDEKQRPRDTRSELLCYFVVVLVLMRLRPETLCEYMSR